MIYRIEVYFKRQFKDRHGEHVKREITGLGVRGVSAVKYSPVSQIEGNISRQEAERIASRLLIDPITETYALNPEKPRPGTLSVYVWLKKGVTDTVAESVAKAVKDIGITEPIRIRTGHKFEFSGKVTPGALRAAAEKLLFNPMIQECEIRKAK